MAGGGAYHGSHARQAEVAHLVEHNLAKVGVAGSSPVFRSKKLLFKVILEAALVVELVDTQDLKSCSPQRECGFKSRLGHNMSRSERVGFFVRRLFRIIFTTFSHTLVLPSWLKN